MAIDDQGCVSRGKSMPWPKNSNDLKWFKKNTLNQVVVMGSLTWQDPFMPTPLVSRINVLITSKSSFPYVAGLFSTNRVIYNKFWHEPKSYWEIG